VGVRAYDTAPSRILVGARSPQEVERNVGLLRVEIPESLWNELPAI
jgi:aryl-alcohol dehydrogenase-like predicted oxidoreductase